VLVGGALDIEGERVREHALDAVGRRVEQEELLTLGDRLTADFDVAGRRAGHVADG
jgi:hypothetical protein